MRRPLPPLVAVLLAAQAAPALADSVTDQLDQARRYYEQGDIGAALGELEFAAQELKGKQAAAYLATFPAPAAGWVLEEASQGETAAVPFLGNATGRTYRAEGGVGSIEAQVMGGGSLMQGLAAMFMNPQMLAAQPNAKRIRVGRENAVAIYDPDERTGQVMLDLGGKLTIMLDGKGLASADPMVDLVNRWDLKRLREIAGL